MRSPRRPWKASSTASFTSLVSAGSAVWLSNGRMATVLMLGRPPPLKPYRHPVSARARALAAPAPRRRIEHHRRVHRTDRELKTRRALRKVDAGAGRHRTNVQLGAATRDHLALPPPLRLQHARPAPRQAIVERVLTLHEPPDPHTIRAGPPPHAPEPRRAYPRRPPDANTLPQTPICGHTQPTTLPGTAPL